MIKLIFTGDKPTPGAHDGVVHTFYCVVEGDEAKTHQFTVNAGSEHLMASFWSSAEPDEEYQKYYRCIFYGLTKFISEFYTEYGELPTDGTLINGESRIHRLKNGRAIQVVVDTQKERNLSDNVLFIS
jgi:hypothetical protein